MAKVKPDYDKAVADTVRHDTAESAPGTTEREQSLIDALGDSVPTRTMPKSIRECKLGDPPQMWPTTLDTRTELGMARVVDAMNPPTLTLDGDGILCMRLRHFVYCVADAEDRETGEVDAAPKTVLIDGQGRTFSTRSQYAPDKMENYRAVFSAESWAKGIPVRIREFRSPRTKQTSHVIEIDLSQEV